MSASERRFIAEICRRRFVHRRWRILYKLTYLITQCSTVLLQKVTGFQLVKKLPPFFWNPKVHYRIHKGPPTVHTLSQIDPVHTHTSHFLKIHFNIIIPSMPESPKWYLSLRFPHQKPVYASPLSHMRYMTRPSLSSRFYHAKNIS